MYPVMNPSIDFLKKTLLQALHWLDQAEFKVQIVIANNTMTYRKIYRLVYFFSFFVKGSWRLKNLRACAPSKCKHCCLSWDTFLLVNFLTSKTLFWIYNFRAIWLLGVCPLGLFWFCSCRTTTFMGHIN